jgi:hypothetical protein
MPRRASPRLFSSVNLAADGLEIARGMDTVDGLGEALLLFAVHAYGFISTSYSIEQGTTERQRMPAQLLVLFGNREQDCAGDWCNRIHRN